MANTELLSLALVTDDDLSDRLVGEILDHQGIYYQIVEKDSSKEQSSFPIALVRRNCRDGNSIAKRFCKSDQGVIEIDSVLDLVLVRNSLAGFDEEKNDKLDFKVNKEELKLVGEIRRRLTALGLPFVRKAFWPNNAKACVVVTHDIDWLTYSPFHKAVFNGPKSITRFAKLLANGLFSRKNFGWNIPQIIEFERKSGVPSTFFFQTNYGKEKPIADQSLALVKSAGFEIGLHGYHGSHKSAEALNSELISLKSSANTFPEGIRYHILKFRVPDTWSIESQVGLKYDATFYSNEFFGSRSNICFPFHPFIEDSRLPVTELPTSFMDWTALKRKIRGTKLASVIENIRKEIDKYNGVFVLNFHNTYINSDTFPDFQEAFQSAILKINNGNYWTTTGSNCVRWWNERISDRSVPVWDEKNAIIRSESLFPLTVDYSKHFEIKVNPNNFPRMTLATDD